MWHQQERVTYSALAYHFRATEKKPSARLGLFTTCIPDLVGYESLDGHQALE